MTSQSSDAQKLPDVIKAGVGLTAEQVSPLANGVIQLKEIRGEISFHA